ncbi:hypothetical protein DB44_EO00080 [Candidatus Protochlamydia amoebophila]|uniref:Transposase DDE domain-containing protein n=1 Tax=Candidatus Protochlamydia amoebophila TaxID=362787 RepID=A0A0C1H8G1_9BACT|nr:hypothetical protein DB44_EO00080 [Candidatus Protochlamydia amoebophila]
MEFENPEKKLLKSDLTAEIAKTLLRKRVIIETVNDPLKIFLRLNRHATEIPEIFN